MCVFSMAFSPGGEAVEAILCVPLYDLEIQRKSRRHIILLFQSKVRKAARDWFSPAPKYRKTRFSKIPFVSKQIFKMIWKNMCFIQKKRASEPYLLCIVFLVNVFLTPFL